MTVLRERTQRSPVFRTFRAGWIVVAAAVVASLVIHGARHGVAPDAWAAWISWLGLVAFAPMMPAVAAFVTAMSGEMLNASGFAAYAALPLGLEWARRRAGTRGTVALCCVMGLWWVPFGLIACALILVFDDC